MCVWRGGERGRSSELCHTDTIPLPKPSPLPSPPPSPPSLRQLLQRGKGGGAWGPSPRPDWPARPWIDTLSPSAGTEEKKRRKKRKKKSPGKKVSQSPVWAAKGGHRSGEGRPGRTIRRRGEDRRVGRDSLKAPRRRSCDPASSAASFRGQPCSGKAKLQAPIPRWLDKQRVPPGAGWERGGPSLFNTELVYFL